MEETKNNNGFEEYMLKARALNAEYNEKIKAIKKQQPVKGRGFYPEEMILRKERNEKIRQLAEQYHNSDK